MNNNNNVDRGLRNRRSKANILIYFDIFLFFFWSPTLKIDASRHVRQNETDYRRVHNSTKKVITVVAGHILETHVCLVIFTLSIFFFRRLCLENFENPPLSTIFSPIPSVAYWNTLSKKLSRWRQLQKKKRKKDGYRGCSPEFLSFRIGVHTTFRVLQK